MSIRSIVLVSFIVKTMLNFVHLLFSVNTGLQETFKFVIKPITKVIKLK